MGNGLIRRGRPSRVPDCVRQLRALIREGYRVGDFLDGEVALAARLGVARNTLRKAVRELESEGALKTHAGCGTRVCVRQSVVRFAFNCGSREETTIQIALASTGNPVRFMGSDGADYFSWLRDSLDGGDAPDLFLANTPYLSMVLPDCENLRPYFERDPQLHDALNLRLVEALSLGPDLPGLPLWFSPVMMISNEAALADVDPSCLVAEGPGDFPRIVRDMTRHGAGVRRRYGYLHNPFLARMLPIFQAYGSTAGLSPADGSDAFDTLSNRMILDTLTEALAGQLLPMPGNSEVTDYYHAILDRLSKGHVACIVDRLGFEITRIRECGVKLRYDPLLFDESSRAPLMGFYVFMNRRSDRKEEAWGVIRSLFEREAQIRFVENGLGLSIRKDCKPFLQQEQKALDYAENGRVFAFSPAVQQNHSFIFDKLCNALMQLETSVYALQECDRVVAGAFTHERSQQPSSVPAEKRHVHLAHVMLGGKRKPHVSPSVAEFLVSEAIRGGAGWVIFSHAGRFRARTGCEPEAVPDGPTTRRLSELAVRLGCAILYPLIEKSGNCLYKSRIFIDSSGMVIRYRKTYLTAAGDREMERPDDDWRRFDPGQGPECFLFEGIRVACIMDDECESVRCLERLAALRPELVFHFSDVPGRGSGPRTGKIARDVGAPVLFVSNEGGGDGNSPLLCLPNGTMIGGKILPESLGAGALRNTVISVLVMAHFSGLPAE
jgi:hypothetical protein